MNPATGALVHPRDVSFVKVRLWGEGVAVASGAPAGRGMGNPRPSLHITPHHAFTSQVDAEGFDIEIYFALQQLLQLGRVPFLTMEFSIKAVDLGSVHCDALKFIQVRAGGRHGVGEAAQAGLELAACAKSLPRPLPPSPPFLQHMYSIGEHWKGRRPAIPLQPLTLPQPRPLTPTLCAQGTTFTIPS